MFSSCLNLLHKSSNVEEKKGDTSRPVSQQEGKRNHPAIMKTLMMIMPKKNDGEERITKGHYCSLPDKRDLYSSLGFVELKQVDYLQLLS